MTARLKPLLLAALLAGSSVAGVAGMAVPPAQAAQVDVLIGRPPPPPRVEAVPPPRAGYVWAPGHWVWDGHRHVWSRGRWLAERRGMRYAPAHWAQAPNGWHYIPGHWQR